LQFRNFEHFAFSLIGQIQKQKNTKPLNPSSISSAAPQILFSKIPFYYGEIHLSLAVNEKKTSLQKD
jgi:hypothetical protein